MASGLGEIPGIGLLTGYNPEEVAHAKEVPMQQSLPEDQDPGATSKDEGEDGPGNSWIQVLYIGKEKRRNVPATDFQSQAKSNAKATGEKPKQSKPLRLPSLRAFKQKAILKPRRVPVDLKQSKNQIGEAVWNILQQDLGEGCRYVKPKDRRLAEVINRERLTLLTDADQPTRAGTSSYRDTCPDLTLDKNVESTEWRNLFEQQGSDHCILETIKHRRGFQRKLGKTKITNWDKWRKQRSDTSVTIENIEEWTRPISDSINPIVTDVERTDKDPDVDKHLLSIWKARPEEYEIKLASEDWCKICDRVRGNLGAAQSCNLLRALIDPEKTKKDTTNRPQDHTEDQLVARYLCLDPPAVQPEYEGRENPDLDRPITVGELEYELGTIK
ncbi:hypothetical protein HPB47_006678 [Ixodes persulcatus]|uniref:Uncharacterized protein n=1 Tax=Ixodes persulcatus TaxID=34615 RepID=A0AC60PA66_IXOPE|nr:hypothetical protein HPB47_006678 [Ixodes persulcatus]